MDFILLQYVPSILNFLRVLIMKDLFVDLLYFVKCFFYKIEMII